VHLPTTDGCEPVLTRYTEPEPELRLVLSKLKLELLDPQDDRRSCLADLVVAPTLGIESAISNT
jgi:hypothetical protein